MTLAQRLFAGPRFVAVYDRVRESPLAVLTCGITFEAEADGYAEMFRRAPGRRFLEVACGQGSFGVAVCERVRDARFVALDLSRAQLDRAGRKAAARGVVGAYRRTRGDAERLPVADGRFHGALCVGGLHQIPLPDRAIAEIGRALVPGGVFAGGCFTLGPRFMRPFGMNAIDVETLTRWLESGGFAGVRCRQAAPMWCLFEAVRR